MHVLLHMRQCVSPKGTIHGNSAYYYAMLILLFCFSVGYLFILAVVIIVFIL